MASVLGHGLCGLISANLFQAHLEPQRKRWLVGLCALIALLPDLDVVVYALFKVKGMTPHRGFSHSLVFAFLVTALSVLLTCGYFRVSKARLFVIYGCAALSAPLLDYFMGAGPAVPFFAPFWDQGFLFPIQVIPTAYYSKRIKNLISILWYPPAVVGYVFEIFIFVPIVIFLATREARRTFVRFLILSVSVFALLISMDYYNH